jgi:ATP-dependent DNA ligase
METICDGCRSQNARRGCGSCLRRSHGIQYVEHTEGDGAEMYEAACKLELEGIVSKRLTAP